MKRILNIDTINEYNTIVDYETLHPLVSVINFSNTKPKKNSTVDSISLDSTLCF